VPRCDLTGPEVRPIWSLCARDRVRACAPRSCRGARQKVPRSHPRGLGRCPERCRTSVQPARRIDLFPAVRRPIPFRRSAHLMRVLEATDSRLLPNRFRPYTHFHPRFSPGRVCMSFRAGDFTRVFFDRGFRLEAKTQRAKTRPGISQLRRAVAKVGPVRRGMHPAAVQPRRVPAHVGRAHRAVRLTRVEARSSSRIGVADSNARAPGARVGAAGYRQAQADSARGAGEAMTTCAGYASGCGRRWVQSLRLRAHPRE
jgi:hypothetical protein